MRGAGTLAGGLAVLSLAAAAPAASSVPARPAAPRSSAPRPAADATVAQAARLAAAGDCAGVLRLLDPLVARAAPASGARFSAQLLRMPCLAQVGRGREVPAVLAEVRDKAPDHPLVLGFQVFADADAGRFADAADALANLADTGSPALQLMPGSLWRALAQRLTLAHDRTRRERTALALARAGWTPADQPELADSLAVQGIAALLGEDDPDQARALLARVDRPAALWDMAIQRRFAPVWSAIEARLGPASGTAADRYARAALDRFATEGEDDGARLDAVRAFIALGRAADASAAARPVAVAAGMSEDRVETVVADAQALAAGGDPAAAVARLEPFARLDLAATPQAASAVIALAEALHEAGRYDAELALARTATGTAATPFSAFGIAWLHRDEACALAGLHRDAEAKAAGDALAAAAGDNQAAAVEGLLCLGRDEEAARIAVATFATPEGADRLADQFQPSDALFLHPTSRLRALWARLLDRRDVRAAFDRAARILPRPLWPAATPRPLPAPAPSGRPDLTTT